MWTLWFNVPNYHYLRSENGGFSELYNAVMYAYRANRASNGRLEYAVTWES